ncbi:hypothetical protein [Micromonospora chalcea]|uniref:hypothetical protein n=1 Tax=Micromonospora chalcea TaxID=1874 RepID=UPI003D75FC16
MITNLQVLVEPAGPADDAPMIPSTYQGGLLPVPQHDNLSRVLDAFLGAPWPLQIAAIVATFALLGGVVLVALRLLRLLTAAAGRVRGVKRSAQLTEAERAANARNRAERFTYAIGAYGSTVSLANSIYVVRHVPDGNPIVWAVFIAIAALYELFVLMLGARALANALERGRLGLEGNLLWVAVGIIAVFIYTKQEDPTLRTTAVIPLLTGLAYFLFLLHVARKTRVRLGSLEDQAEDFSGTGAPAASTNPLAYLWKLILTWLGLVEQKGFGALAKYRRKQAIKLAQLSYRRDALAPAEGEKPGEEYFRLTEKYHKAVAKMGARYPSNTAFQADVMPAFGLIYGAADAAAAAVAASISNPWAVAEGGSGSDQSGTGNAIGSGSGNADSGSGKTGSGSDNRTGSGSANSRGSGSAKPAGTGSKLTVRDVEAVRSSWSTGEHAARLDYDTARAHATEIGREVFASTGQAKAGMRAYYVVMAAANHEVKGGQMREDVTGQKDTNGQGRNLARTWKAELAADADTAAGATQTERNASK